LTLLDPASLAVFVAVDLHDGGRPEWQAAERDAMLLTRGAASPSHLCLRVSSSLAASVREGEEHAMGKILAVLTMLVGLPLAITAWVFSFAGDRGACFDVATGGVIVALLGLGFIYRSVTRAVSPRFRIAIPEVAGMPPGDQASFAWVLPEKPRVLVHSPSSRIRPRFRRFRV
jgi:hypothetical protein